MVSRGIVFLNVGSRYAFPLAVAIATLREHCDAPVAIICDTDSGLATAQQLAIGRWQCGTIQVLPQWDLRERAIDDPVWAYLFKTRLPSLSPFQDTLLLDSDTLVAGDISELWPQAGDAAVLTKRNGGRHQNLKARLRCQKWGHIDAARAARARSRQYRYPPINTGVMTFGSDSGAFCAEWRRLAEANPIHSCDEQAAQLIYPDFPVRLVDYRYNASIIHDRELPDVRIWHGVAKKFWGDARGRQLWLPAARWCLQENFGNARALLGTFAWAGGRTWRNGMACLCANSRQDRDQHSGFC